MQSVMQRAHALRGRMLRGGTPHDPFHKDRGLRPGGCPSRDDTATRVRFGTFTLCIGDIDAGPPAGPRRRLCETRLTALKWCPDQKGHSGYSRGGSTRRGRPCWSWGGSWATSTEGGGVICRRELVGL